MKPIDEVNEHNKRVTEEKKAREAQRKEEEKFVQLYCKGLPDDTSELGVRATFYKRGVGQLLWELGRVCIKARLLLPYGQFHPWMGTNHLNPSTVYRAINSVMNIPDADLKALSKNAQHAFELPGPMTEDEEHLAERIESDDCSAKDFARRSPTDIKKMLGRIEKLTEEVQSSKFKIEELQKENDQLKLGSIDERKIRDYLGSWQLAFITGLNHVLRLGKISEQSQRDVYACFQWLAHQLMLMEIDFAERFPKFDTYGGPDRNALAEWMASHGRAGQEFMLPDSEEKNFSTTGDTGTGESPGTKKGKRKKGKK